MEGRTLALVKKQSEEEKTTTRSTDLPPMRILTVSREGAVFYRMEEREGSSSLVIDDDFPKYPFATLGKFAHHYGHFAVIADPTIGLHVVDCSTGKEARLIIKSTAISALTFSPRDSFFVTCEKFLQGEKNLIVWNLAAGIEMAKFEWKKGSKEGTKSIKFSEDERFCARISSRTQIEVYDCGNFNEPKARINASVENLGKKGGKQEEEKSSKAKYWFDGFEFIPAQTAPGGASHQFLFAW
jgi:hypothetical protein